MRNLGLARANKLHIEVGRYKKYDSNCANMLTLQEKKEHVQMQRQSRR